LGAVGAEGRQARQFAFGQGRGKGVESRADGGQVGRAGERFELAGQV